jgi:EmrB/QacA subfamily drug resistance transporter
MTVDPVVYRRRWKTLAVLSLSLVIIGLDNTILNVALPSLQTHFNASTSTLQWMVDSYLLVFAGMLLTMGTLGDRFGRKRALQGGLLLFGGASLAVLLVDTSSQLIAIRAVMGIGGAMIMPATLSIISNVFPREERAKAIGIWAAMAAVGIGLGPLFGGILLEYFSWTSVFMVNVPVAFTALTLGIWLVPESRDPEPGRFDGLGAVLSMGALGTLVYGIIEAPEKSWTDPVVLSAFAAGILLSALFVIWELRTSHPMLNLSFFRDPRFSVASGAIGLASFALFGGIFALTQFLQDARGYSALEAGCAMVPLAFGLVVGSGSSVKLVAKRGTTRVVMAGLLGLAAVLTSSLVWSYDMPYWPLGISIFLLAVFMGWVMGPGTSSVMGSVPEEKAGVASAMNDVTRQVAGALGTAVIGSLISSVYQTRISDDTSVLPAAAQSTAQDSVGGAHAVASVLPTVDASALTHAANVAYTDAMGIGFMVAGLVSLTAAMAVRRWLPARQADTDPTVGVLPSGAEALSEAA